MANVRRNVAFNAVQVLDQNAATYPSSSLPITLGQLSAPTSAIYTITFSTTGGTFTGANVYLFLTFPTSLNNTGGSNGETNYTAFGPYNAIAGTGSFVVTVVGQVPAGAPSLNVYDGTSSTAASAKLNQSGIASGNTFSLTAPSPSGAAPPSVNTSWPSGLLCTMIRDNDTSATTVPTYPGTAGSWTQGTGGIPALAVTIVSLGNGRHQFGMPNAAFSQASSTNTKIVISMTGMQTMEFDYNYGIFDTNASRLGNDTNAATQLANQMNSQVSLTVSNDNPTPTPTSFTVNVSGSPSLNTNSSFYSTPPSVVAFYTGNELPKASRVTAYSYTGGVGTFTLSPALPAAPAVGDKFIVLAL